MTTTDEPLAASKPTRHRHPAPPIIGPFEPDAWYRGTAVVEMFGKNWQSWLNDRNEGRDGPTATIIGGRIYFRGRDITAWLDGRREG